MKYNSFIICILSTYFFFSCENKYQEKEIFYTDSSKGVLSIHATESLFYWGQSEYDLKMAKFPYHYLAQFSKQEFQALHDSIYKNKHPEYVYEEDVYRCFLGTSHIMMQGGVKDTFYFVTSPFNNKIRDYIEQIIEKKQKTAKRQNKYFGFEYMKKHFQMLYEPIEIPQDSL